MDLTALFDMQRELDADIEEQYPMQEYEDRFGKKVLALLVEFGELARRWNGFAYWSKNQKAYTKVELLCVVCKGTGKIGEENPLLEKYVDVLCLALSLGNDLEIAAHYTPVYEEFGGFLGEGEALVYQFTYMNELAAEMGLTKNKYTRQGSWDKFMSHLLGLGEMLGFTWEQIEAAYKEKVNQKRTKGT